jgi:hypothetical protein
VLSVPGVIPAINYMHAYYYYISAYIIHYMHAYTVIYLWLLPFKVKGADLCCGKRYIGLTWLQNEQHIFWMTELCLVIAAKAYYMKLICHK